MIPGSTGAPTEQASRRQLTVSAAQQVAAVFRALSDPNRVRLVAELAQHEACVGELAAASEMSQSAVSHQLRDMHAQGLVRRRRSGRNIYYALDDDHVRDLFALALAHIDHRAVTA